MTLRAFLAGALSAGVFMASRGEVPGEGGGTPRQTEFRAGGSSLLARNALFVGSKACRECHAATHSNWSNARHSKMLQEARPASVIPAFDRTVTLHDKEFRLEKDGEAYFVTENYFQSKPTRRRVDYTLGSRRVQHYLSRLEDGRIVVLPPSFDIEKKEWFHNLDIVDLEETNAVKVQVWNSNCFGCHVSGERKGFDPTTRTYTTTWTDFGTSCERCHGPGKAHTERYAQSARNERASPDRRAGRKASSTSPGVDRGTAILHPRHVGSETSTTLCAQCHSLRDITQTGFAGGDNYYDFFTPLLEYAQKRNHDPAYWPNGRPRRFSNEAIAFWLSQCSFKGGAVCLDCHNDVHEPDIDKNAGLARKQDDLCTGCHQAIAAQGREHTHHDAGTAAAVSCVSCHMPRTTISLRHRMPDHTISLPAPENTRRFGIPNACNECHLDQSPQWSEAKLDSWFPKGRRERTVLDAVAFSLGAQRDPEAIGPLVEVANDAARPPLMRANALGHLRAFNDPRATAALLAASRDEHPAVRLGAFLALADRGGNPAVREALERGLEDARRTVRMASSLGLLNARLGPASAFGPKMETALAEHAERARFLNEDANVQLELGKMLFLAGDWKKAEAALRDALQLDSGIQGGRYFLGMATLGQGRVAEGVALLRQVDRKDPHRKDAEAILAKLKTS